MILAEFLPANADRSWPLARQVGVTHAICKAAPELTGLPAPDDFPTLQAIRDRFAQGGLTLCGLEGDQFDMSRIKLGLPGRDDDIERYKQMLRNMGALGIGLLCYNFMAGTGWYRGGMKTVRGGALGAHCRAADAPATTPAGPVTQQQVWDNYEYFLRAVLPTAERAGVRMGLHPDDPPLPSLSGVGRIFGSVAAFDRAYAIAPCRANAVTFCQANFKLMDVTGTDLAAVAKHFGDRIAFIHVRDVRGTPEDFVEVFHDENDVDQPRLFELYARLGLDVPVRCDHVPTMAGEENDTSFVPGYGTLGRLFAVGYFKGILQTLGVAHR